MRLNTCVVSLAMGVFLLSGPGANAQPARAWEIEVHGGGAVPSTPLDGTGELPPEQALVPPNSTRPVSSWYFGDGTRQLNLLASVRRTAPLVPLDSTLQSSIVERPSAGVFGVRVSRRISTRISAELSIDSAAFAVSLTDDARLALEASHASFVTALGDFFTLPMGSRTVNSTLAISEGDARQIVTTGAVRFDLMPDRRWTPYVIGGLGVNSTQADDVRAVLTGTYEVVLSNLPPTPATFSQADTLTLTSHVDSALVWLFGGGVRLPLGDRWGLRVDVRDWVQRNRVTTHVSAAPTLLPPFSSTTFGAQVSDNPPLIFSGRPSVTSTLSVPITDFVTFSGDGAAHQLSVTVGASWRF
ncbi:MAG TPA: hypothetical protein VGF24_33110 [Vicinamibacterales bacterium]|jgi:hypothetical protein